MTFEDLRKIQKIDTDMLSYVDALCREHHIEYFMMYGTLLGAVRHGGPIPWDDDVDIAMTRENYNRFLELVKKELDPKYELHIMGSEGSKNTSELKIGYRGSKLYLPETKDLNVMYQINLDIFLLDYIKATPLRLKLYPKIVSVLRIVKLPWDEKKLLFHAIDHSNRHGKMVYKCLLAITHLSRMLFGESAFETLLYNLFVDERRISGKMAVVNVPDPRVWDEKDFLPASEMRYQCHIFMAPANADHVLKIRYGNYMELPKEENRYRKNFDRYIFELAEGEVTG